MTSRFFAVLIFTIFLTLPAAAAQCGGSFNGFLAQMAADAQAAGVSRPVINQAFAGLTPNGAVLAFDRRQQGMFHSKSFEEYARTRVIPARISRARRLMQTHAQLLSRIERQFGVPRTLLMAIWTMESDNGTGDMGKLPVIRTLATMAHDCRRTELFQGELIAALKIILLDRSQAAVMALVKNGDIDFGLALESQVPSGLLALPWQPVQTVLMVPRDHPLTHLKRVTLRQVARHPLILPPRGPEYPGRQILDEQFRKLGLSPNLVMESANVELSALYVEMGLGVSFATLARDLPELSRRRLAFLPLPRHFKPDHLAVVLRRDKVLTLYKKAFINLLFGDTIV